VRLPFLVWNTPDEMGGTKVTTELTLKLIDRLKNFAGVVDSSLDWQFMIEVISSAQRVRPGFQLLSGTEYMISSAAIGGSGVFAALAGVAPRMVRELYEHCRKEQYGKGRRPQEAIAALRQAVKKDGIAGLKGALRAMGRDCGEPRPPLTPLGEEEYGRISDAISAMAALRAEPRGW
jgi:dihydrodipicolinate synthase/N-acetylneuraminate lyase